MKQYIDKAAVIAEIERRQKIHFTEYHINENNTPVNYGACKALTQILDFINTLEVKEVEEEPVSEELKEAADEWDGSLYRSDAFIAGANWQKQQMMKDAINGKVINSGNSGSVLDTQYGVLYLNPSSFHYGDKVKVVIIKE